MAMAFIQNSQEYLRKIDEEVQRLQDLRAQVALAIEGDEAVAVTPRGKRSDEARERMAQAQKARWAQNKATGKKVPTKQALKPAVRKTSAKKSNGSPPAEA